MSPGSRDLQLTLQAAGVWRSTYPPSVRADDPVDMEEGTRLLDSYGAGDYKLESIEEGSMRRIQVNVTGMTCAACSNSVEAALKSIDGVLRASVALLQNRADVVFDPNLVKVTALSSLISILKQNEACRVCFIR